MERCRWLKRDRFHQPVASRRVPSHSKTYPFWRQFDCSQQGLGGLRPIAIGYLWRRLAAKCANRRAVARLSAHFMPVQLGTAVPGGCEAAVHNTRRFIRSMRPDQVLVKLDFTNAFNSLRRDIMLSAVYKTI